MPILGDVIINDSVNSVSDLSSIPTANLVTGSIVFLIAETQLYWWNGTVWKQSAPYFFHTNIDPNSNDDETLGYAASSVWVNSPNNTVFICSNATAGNAIWRLVSNNKTNIDTVDPSSSNDSTENYSIFSLWLNSTTDEQFMCVDATVGAAVWRTNELDIDALPADVAADTQKMVVSDSGVLKSLSLSGFKTYAQLDIDSLPADIAEGSQKMVVSDVGVLKSITLAALKTYIGPGGGGVTDGYFDAVVEEGGTGTYYPTVQDAILAGHLRILISGVIGNPVIETSQMSLFSQNITIFVQGEWTMYNDSVNCQNRSDGTLIIGGLSPEATQINLSITNQNKTFFTNQNFQNFYISNLTFNNTSTQDFAGALNPLGNFIIKDCLYNLPNFVGCGIDLRLTGETGTTNIIGTKFVGGGNNAGGFIYPTTNTKILRCTFSGSSLKDLYWGDASTNKQALIWYDLTTPVNFTIEQLDINMLGAGFYSLMVSGECTDINIDTHKLNNTSLIHLLLSSDYTSITHVNFGTATISGVTGGQIVCLGAAENVTINNCAGIAKITNDGFTGEKFWRINNSSFSDAYSTEFPNQQYSDCTFLDGFSGNHSTISLSGGQVMELGISWGGSYGLISGVMVGDSGEDQGSITFQTGSFANVASGCNLGGPVTENGTANLYAGLNALRNG